MRNKNSDCFKVEELSGFDKALMTFSVRVLTPVGIGLPFTVGLPVNAGESRRRWVRCSSSRRGGR
jgi:hypothetical protein